MHLCTFCYLPEKLVNSLVPGVGLSSYQSVTCESVKVLTWNIFPFIWKMSHWDSNFKMVRDPYELVFGK
jgi:hypothetical protein